jgi:hypothetical protein
VLWLLSKCIPWWPWLSVSWTLNKIYLFAMWSITEQFCSLCQLLFEMTCCTFYNQTCCLLHTLSTVLYANSTIHDSQQVHFLCAFLLLYFRKKSKRGWETCVVLCDQSNNIHNRYWQFYFCPRWDAVMSAVML